MKRKLILGLKVDINFKSNSSIGGIGFALIEQDNDLYINEGFDSAKFTKKKVDFSVSECGGFLKSRYCTYKIFHTNSYQESKDLFLEKHRKYGNIFGASSKNHRLCILGCKTITQDMIELSRRDAMKTIEWYQFTILNNFKNKQLRDKSVIDAYKNNIATKKICNLYNIGEATLFRILKQHGIPLKGAKFNELVRDKVVKMYLDPLNTINDIMEACGINSEQTIYRILHEKNIKLRNN